MRVMRAMRAMRAMGAVLVAAPILGAAGDTRGQERPGRQPTIKVERTKQGKKVYRIEAPGHYHSRVLQPQLRILLPAPELQLPRVKGLDRSAPALVDRLKRLERSRLAALAHVERRFADLLRRPSDRYWAGLTRPLGTAKITAWKQSSSAFWVAARRERQRQRAEITARYAALSRALRAQLNARRKAMAQALRRLFERAPRQQHPALLLAQAWADPKRSSEALQRLLREHPDSALQLQARHRLALILHTQGKVQRAVELLLSGLCPAAKLNVRVFPSKGEADLSDTQFEGCRAGGPPWRSPRRARAAVWMQLGQWLFDDSRLGPAQAAFDQVVKLGRNGNPYHAPALYLRGWTRFRLDRLESAAQDFVKLATLTATAADSKRAATLQAEAVWFAAVTFAENDWDGDTLPDKETSLQRLERLVPRGPHAPLIHHKLAEIHYDSTRYDMAVELYRLLLKRWPESHRAPQVQGRLITSFERMRRFDDAMNARTAYIKRFSAGSAWARANRLRPLLLRRTHTRLRRLLLEQAIFQHRVGHVADARLAEQRRADPALRRQAEAAWPGAVRAYEAYLKLSPNGRQSPAARDALAACRARSLDKAWPSLPRRKPDPHLYGSIDPRAGRLLLSYGVSALRTCRGAKGVEPAPARPARIAVRLQVGAHGRPVRVKLTRSGGFDRGLARCFEAQAKGWHFPLPEFGTAELSAVFLEL
jgi:tetratricopeptide (TPR) repeat protein